MLSLAVPFGLLPASDPRLLRIAESILRANVALKGDSNVLARVSFEPLNQAGPTTSAPTISTTYPAWRRSGWSGS